MREKVPPRPFRPFTIEEYTDRVTRARTLMAEAGLDALLITTEPNFRYFSGFHSQGWVSPTRPMFLVVPLRRDPVAVIPTGSRVVMRQTSWISDVRTWTAPRPEDDGVSLLIEALRETVGPRGRIGAEFGPETQLRMPLADFFRVREAVAPIEFVDGTSILRKLRMVKSPAEVDRIRAIAEIVSDGFASLPDNVRIGDTERDVCLWLQIEILRAGGDRSPYLIAASGPGGYETINTNPSDRILSHGDVLIIDTGSTVDGYFCDFDRNWAFGDVPKAAREAHARAYAATEAGLSAARPGNRTCDVWHAMAEALGMEAVEGSDVGRMGHGLGLQLTEPPSIHPSDTTIIEPGMVLTLEPGIAFIAEDGSRRVMVHEENIVITEAKAELLTRRAPAEMPVII
jgi:Xaa-Pro dipeptidase